MENFTPAGYEPPKTNSHYLKLKNGSNVMRILSSPLLGWIDWKDSKPVRTPYQGERSMPKPIDPSKPVRHFWAFSIWDYSDGTIKILEVVQSTIQDAIYTLSLDEAWGNPKGYDIDIKKTGESKETKYSVVPKPPKELSEEIKEAMANTKINLNALLSNDDPFSNDPKIEQAEIEEFSTDDIPFN